MTLKEDSTKIGFPLEGKLSPKVTDEVSTDANLRLFQQKKGRNSKIFRCFSSVKELLFVMGTPHPSAAQTPPPQGEGF